MAKKFDTNPLDPDFPRKVREAEMHVLQNEETETVTLPKYSVSEETTRRFDEANFRAHQNAFGTDRVPANFHTTKLDAEKEKKSRKVAKVGLPENILTALPYLPFSIGLIAGILELVFVPKSETKTRFHAAQGLAAHIGILLITTILGFGGNITDLADIGNGIFQLVTTIMLIVFAVKSWQGKPVHIESVDDLTNWLEDKIKPRN